MSSTTLPMLHPKGTRGRACIAICITSLAASVRCVFYADIYDLDANDGTDTIILRGSKTATHSRGIWCRLTYAVGFLRALFRTHSRRWSCAPFAAVRFLAQSGIPGPCQLPGHISIFVGDPCPILGIREAPLGVREAALRNGEVP